MTFLIHVYANQLMSVITEASTLCGFQAKLDELNISKRITKNGQEFKYKLKINKT